MAQGDADAKAPRRIDVILMRVFYVEAILFMAGLIALGAYLYPTIMRFVDLSFRIERIGDIGALVDDQVARVEGKLNAVTGRIGGQLDGLDRRISGVTSRLDGQVTGVEKRLDGMFKGLEERLRDIFKLKFGELEPGRPGDAREEAAAALAR